MTEPIGSGARKEETVRKTICGHDGTGHLIVLGEGKFICGPCHEVQALRKGEEAMSEVMGAITKAEEGLAELIDIFSRDESGEATVHKLIRALQVVETLKAEEEP
jgi:hypothetical protein